MIFTYSEQSLWEWWKNTIKVPSKHHESVSAWLMGYNSSLYEVIQCFEWGTDSWKIVLLLFSHIYKCTCTSNIKTGLTSNYVFIIYLLIFWEPSILYKPIVHIIKQERWKMTEKQVLTFRYCFQIHFNVIFKLFSHSHFTYEYNKQM